MKIEHVAFNVEDPRAMAAWYVQHLGFTVKRHSEEPPYAHFLADDSGTVMLELYGNRDVPTPDYRAGHPMALHLALVCDDVEGVVARLSAAGAEALEVRHADNGDHLAMLRDPWGFCVQLVNRTEPMF